MTMSTIDALRHAVQNIPAGEIWTPDVFVDIDPTANKNRWFWRDRRSSDGKAGFRTEADALRDALKFADIDPAKVIRRAKIKDDARDPRNDDHWETPEDQVRALKLMVQALETRLAHLPLPASR